MSFFSEASLAMIPSGYKTSKVYSAIPTSGDGDLTFSRSNDTATRVGPDGLIEKVRTNQVQQSETFDNVYWTKTNLSVTANAIANPLDGALTAELLTVTDPSGPVEKTILNGNQSYTAGTPYTISAYFKAGTISTDFRILAFDDVTLYQSGIIDLATIGNSTAPYEDVGGGWYRFRFTFTPANSTATGLVYLVNYAFGIAANAGTNVYVYGAQIETGDIATDYIATTTAAVSVGPVANLPRLDYSGGATCPKLLLEGQRTNLFLWSEQLGNWGGASAGTLLSNAAISPDGYQNADVIEATDGDPYRYQNINFTGTVTFSLYVKGIGTSIGKQGDIRFGSNVQVFTLTGSWQRVSITAAASGSTNYGIETINPAVVGEQVAVWGAQLEAGAYATSYINTLGAAVTRGVDSASKTGISSLIGQTEGTLFAEGSSISTGSGTGLGDSGYLFAISDNTLDNQISIRLYPFDGNYYLQVRSGGAAVVGTTYTPTSVGQNVKIAIAYKANDFAFYVNGTQIATASSGAVPALSAVNFGQFVGPLDTIVNQKQALLFKTRLTNAQLAELTA
jgi:hypothetical protein